MSRVDDAMAPGTIPSIVPLERLSIAEQVAKHLLDLIRTGALQPGQQLPTERDLAASLHVSRPSVREALRGLQILGVVKSRQGGGIFVSSLEAADLLQPLHVFLSLSPENFRALHEARVVVEGTIGRMVAQRITPDVVSHLAAMVQTQTRLMHDPVAFRVSDMEFHRVLREQAANPYLERISLSLYVLGAEYRRLSWETPAMLKRSLADHQEIIAALQARDADRMQRAMERHMNSQYESVRHRVAGDTITP